MNISKDFFSLFDRCYSFPVMCSTFHSHSSAGDYLLEEEALFSSQRFCATSSESSFSKGTTTLCYKDARKQATIAHFLEFMFFLL